MSTDLYKIALAIAPGIGGVTARNLLSHFKEAENIFRVSKKELLQVNGIGEKVIHSLTQPTLLEEAHKELLKIQKEGVKIIFFSDPEFPHRLRHAYDAPVLLYTKGNLHLNPPKVLGIVGTRKSTDYGKYFVENFVKEIAIFQPLIVSGLAYGIDILAHKEALKNNLPTVAVMANGLDMVYPRLHKDIAEKMLHQGGWISESRLGTKPDALRFPARNRITAGLVDALLIVESFSKGGAMITAHYANDYNRDVFAVPGNINSSTSAGCNSLIKKQKAHLIESAADLIYIMGWSGGSQKQLQIFENNDKLLQLPELQQQIIHLLSKHSDLSIDQIALHLKMAVNELGLLLLDLEINDWIDPLPGKRFKLKGA